MAEVYPTLFSTIKPGPLTLRNRIAMAPLTRRMAEADGTPNEAMAACYTSGADMAAIGRPIFAQPDWPYIVRSGVPYDWRRLIANARRLTTVSPTPWR